MELKSLFKKKMKIKLIKGAKLPKQGRSGDAGYDLYLLDDVTFKPKDTTVVDTGVCIQLPKNHAGLLAMRSSVCKKGLIIQQPLIDSNYRGEIHVLVYNPNEEEITYKKGDRVCSLYMFPVYMPILKQVDELDGSNRGASWAGSSGK